MKNRLTLFLETLGHGFIGLECESCADGKPAEIKAGFYPGTRIECTDEVKEDPNDLIPNLRKALNTKLKTGLPTIISVNAATASDHPIVTGALTATGSAVNPSIKYSLLNEEAVDGKSRCNASDDGINFKMHSGNFQKQLDSFYRISYEITSEDSINIYKRIKELAENDVENYNYAWLGHNCLDFTKDMYEITSLESKSLSGMYNFNPLVSITGFNGVSAAYMAHRDNYNMACSNPALALCTGLALFGVYKWTSKKISRYYGTKFDPETILPAERSKHLNLIRQTKKSLLKAINVSQYPLIKARAARENAYNVPSRKDDYVKITAFYKTIERFIKTSEDTLAAVNQLAKDYNSLSKEYCSNTYAYKILAEINELHKINKLLKKSIDQIMQEQSNYQQLDEQPKATRRRHRR